MNNDELKKKICEIIDSSCSFYCGSNVHMDDEQENAIADALISAGIGDASSEKAMRELAEAFHREKCAEYDLLNYQMQKSEYRVVEAEHRAEVAERALQIMAYKIARTNISEPIVSAMEKEVCGVLLQAEKELAEERKDEQMR